MIELHAAKTGNSIRSAIALEEGGLPYNVYHVDLGRGEHRAPPHLALNPAGKVPTLVERRSGAPAFVLSQSNAIMMYAASQAPGRLIPRHEGPERALAFERYFFFITDVIAPSHAAFYLKSHDSYKPAIDALDARALEAIQLAEGFLTESPYMTGKSFGLADIAAVTITAAVESTVDWGRLPNLHKWFLATRERPSVQHGFRVFDQFG